MVSPVVFYLPNVLGAEVAACIPAGVAFVQTGLEEAAPDAVSDAASGAGAAEACFRAGLPLSRAEAKAALTEMLLLAADHAGGGELLQRDSSERLFSSAGSTRSREERAALEAFARDGSVPESGGDSGVFGGRPSAAFGAGAGLPDARRALIDCQKTLLLARELELRQAEIRQARLHSLRAEEQLLHALHGKEGEDLFDFQNLREHGLVDADEAPPPWRAVLEAALAFAPDAAVFFTADVHMARELYAMDMLRPLPQGKAHIPADWPQDLRDNLLFADFPAWRLVGRHSLPPDRPWLARPLCLFAARPQGGWRQDAPDAAFCRADRYEGAAR